MRPPQTVDINPREKKMHDMRSNSGVFPRAARTCRSPRKDGLFDAHFVHIAIVVEYLLDSLLV